MKANEEVILLDESFLMKMGFYYEYNIEERVNSDYLIKWL